MKAFLLTLAAFSASAGCFSADSRCTPPAGTEPFEFTNGANQLRGFIDFPDADGPHPAVLILHGSGQTDVFHGAGIYLGTHEVMRRTFRAAGVATVVWDNAGNGCSTGSYPHGNPIRERALEAVAALQALKRRADIDAGRLGLWAISQGAWSAPMAAVQTDDVSFLILVSSPTRDAVSQLEYQALNLLRASGVGGVELDSAASHLRRAFAIMRAGGPVETYVEAVEPLQKYTALGDLGITKGKPEDYRRWQNTMDFHYRPDTALRELSLPVLAIFGDHDVLIDWRQSTHDFRNIFRESGNRDVTIKVFKGANHNLTSLGADSQLVDGYLQTMQVWLAKHTGARKAR